MSGCGQTDPVTKKAHVQKSLSPVPANRYPAGSAAGYGGFQHVYWVHTGSSAGKHEVDGDDVVSLLDVVVSFLLDHLADTDGPHHSSPRPPLLFQRRHHNPQRWNCHFLPVLLLLSRSGCLLPHGQHFHRQRCDCVGSLSLSLTSILLLLLLTWFFCLSVFVCRYFFPFFFRFFSLSLSLSLFFFFFFSLVLVSFLFLLLLFNKGGGTNFPKICA